MAVNSQETDNKVIPTPEELYQRARDFQSTLRERSKLTAELRRLPDETIQDMKDLGFFNVLKPKSWGGYEMDPRVFYKIGGILGEACMAVAWVYGVVEVHNWQIALFNKKAQEDVLGEDNGVLISSSYAPKAKSTKQEGGYLVSGEWDWSSGCDHCDWVFLGGIIDPEALGLT